MGFKQATTMIGNAANFDQVPATAGESYAVGEALVLSGGAATKCGATATPGVYLPAAAFWGWGW